MNGTDAPVVATAQVAKTSTTRDGEFTRRMMPRSMVGLIAASKMLAMTPLLIAVVLLSLALERLLERAETLVANGQQVEALGGQLRDELQNLERVGRQYLVLDDNNLLQVFDERLRKVRDTAKLFASDGLPAEVQEPAAILLGELRELRRDWKREDSTSRVRAELVEHIGTLSAQSGRIVVEGRLSIYEQMRELRDQTDIARRLLFVILVFILPLTFLFALGLSVIITRPLKQVRAAIAALGTANYAEPVNIAYPSELARLGQRIEWLRQRLRGFEAEKDRFLRDVSHELKTPLASLREGTDLLLEQSFGSLNARQSEVAQILAESAQDLDGQIANLLAYAEWRSGQREFSTSWFEIRPLIEEVLISQRLPMARRGLRASVVVESGRLFGQRSSLRVALSNLVGNAIKHSPASAIIDIVAARRNERCVLFVRDRGPGVPEVERDRILLPFVRGSAPQASGQHGTGIGLSIVNETMKAHEGTLRIEDAGPGARFLLSWPCPPAAGH